MPSEQKVYRVFLAAIGVLMLGWGVAYGIETYKYDACRETARVRLDDLNAQVDNAKKSLELKK